MNEKRIRRKPQKSFLEKSKWEIANEKMIIVRKAYSLGKIRGKKIAMAKAVEWLKANANKYIVDIGVGYEKTELVIGGACWDDLIKALEDKK